MRLVILTTAVLAIVLLEHLGYCHNVKDDDSDMYMEENRPLSDYAQDYQPQANFYPSFPSYQNPPSGHSRPFYQQQEGAYSHRPQGSYQQRFDYDTAKYTGYKDTPRDTSSENLDVLGSGNFGVIKGGTFYQGSEGGDSSNYDDEYSSYYQNGHGRPSSFYYNQNPRPYQHEQFANFRDFADINTPSYSQYIVVYANKNGTTQDTAPVVAKKRPNNIFESLAQLDDQDDPTTTNPPKKLSKFKRKLALLPREKKVRAKTEGKGQADNAEPLLALS
ncbi:uncharacterized protein LOC123318895 [Coccinella septempunctata]|uniref:uncharacterized protein LOC123318895 n=1 Tax=Coccinella septempunctata TaxID=41139 RepID=UPI001D098F6C|nr:uncharacterized protein LOC123318895 [Coccinella septempunctata]